MTDNELECIECELSAPCTWCEEGKWHLGSDELGDDVTLQLWCQFCDGSGLARTRGRVYRATKISDPPPYLKGLDG